MRFTLMTLLCAGVLSCVRPAFALQCYELALKDEKGAVISVNPAPIGLMVGGNPVLDGDYPTHFKRDIVAPAHCPVALVDGVRKMFNAACPGEDLRKSAAQANKVPLSAIEKGCEDMLVALTNQDAEKYRKENEKRFPGSQSIFPKQPGTK